ncbi:MAG: hypothetical protein JXR97_01535 [Planctomycetes bacterium]|nr:hypothetical protein [Planctomycetota bacterium]
MNVSVEFSDGVKRDKASLFCRPEYEITVFVEKEKQRYKIRLGEIASLSAIVAEEALEKEWRWKEGGSDEKIYTGKAYPWRKHSFEIVKRDGTVIAGNLTSGFPVTLSWEETVQLEDGKVEVKVKKGKYIIRPRDKGELGMTLDELVYIKKITFTDNLPEAETEEKKSDATETQEQG